MKHITTFRVVFALAAAFIVGGFFVAHHVFAEIDGPLNGTIFVDDSTIGNNSWNNVSSVATSDDIYANVILDKNKISHYIKATGFNFSIPTGATIRGIKIEIEKSATNNSITDNSVRLVKGGVIVGDDKAFLNTGWSATDTVSSYGGETDLWNTTWTPPDFNDSNTGIVFSTKHGNTDNSHRTVKVDNVNMTVYYTTNHAPVAVADSYTTNEDTSLVVNTANGVLSNDTDADSNALTALKVTDPTKGTLTLNTNGSFTYVPNANANGNDSFTYKANDGSVDSNTVTVSISITPVNDAPVSVNDAYTVDEDNTLTISSGSGVLANDSDIDLDVLTATTTSNPTHGTLIMNSDGSFSYVPAANYNGSDFFTYRAYDGALYSSDATVSITVHSINDAPVLGSIGNKEVNERMALSFTATSSDVDNDIPVYSLSGTIPDGVTLGSVTGEFNWIPTEAQGPGTYTFTVEVSDMQGGTDSEPITIKVLEVNTPPVAESAIVSTHMNTARSIVLEASDLDIPHTLSYATTTSPAHGVLSLVSGHTFLYTPGENYVGEDSFSFVANDGLADSNVATISISVDDDAPTLSAIENRAVDEETLLEVPTTASDRNDDTLRFSLSGETIPAGLSINSETGLISWTPTEAQGAGEYPVTVVVSDGAKSDSKSFIVFVREVNKAPIAEKVSATTNEDTSVLITLLASDADVPVQHISFSTTTNPIHGMLSEIAGDKIRYTPNANYNGPDSFSYVAYDGVVNSEAVTVDISVTSVNDAPTIALNGSSAIGLFLHDPYTEEGAVTSDIEDASTTYAIAGTVNTEAVGVYDLLYTMTDTGGLSATTSRVVTVRSKPLENTQMLCSDGIDNDNDGLVDLNDPDCSAFVPRSFNISGGGGGGGFIPFTTTTTTTNSTPAVTELHDQAGAVMISWTTDHDAYGHVVYGTSSGFPYTLDLLKPNFGYQYSVPSDPSLLSHLDTAKTSFHSFVLSGLISGETYYYRTVSHASPALVSDEYSFVAPKTGITSQTASSATTESGTPQTTAVTTGADTDTGGTVTTNSNATNHVAVPSKAASSIEISKVEQTSADASTSAIEVAKDENTGGNLAAAASTRLNVPLSVTLIAILMFLFFSVYRRKKAQG